MFLSFFPFLAKDCLPEGHPRCRWLCFFSRTQMKICNSFKLLQSVSHIMALNGTHGFERKNKHTQTKLNPVACDDTLRSKDTKRSVCALNWTVFLYIFFTSDPPHGYHHEPQGLIWFYLWMFFCFFSLKAVSPIDCNYMTDQRYLTAIRTYFMRWLIHTNSYDLTRTI